MIFEFLFPIVGWLVLFFVFFVVYKSLFYKESGHVKQVEGQALFTVLATFFWITVYSCLSSIWSILYSLIDLKYPDVVGAVSDYGTSGFSGSGVVFDAFAFPLAMTLVSAVTACCLAFYLTKKFNAEDALRPEILYHFLRVLVFIGGALLAFSGFVYVVYSWLYGNLPIAIFYKGLVAVLIVGSVALYFYLTDNSNPNKQKIVSRFFAALMVLATIVTLFVSFKVIGTPAEARKYRLDAITLQAIKDVKAEIDNQDQSFGKRISTLKEINNDYVKSSLRRTSVEYFTEGESYKLCSVFNSDMPKTINWEDRDTTWDYKLGNHCFEFKHLPPYPYVQNQGGEMPPKPVYNQ